MKLTIDNRNVEFGKEMTLLQAAQASDIYIPHICAHPELSYYGGCRLCIVEVDGIKGYPTACTTRIKEGMVVRTNTAELNKMRREILQLTLSEHPSGCLVCDEEEECRDFQGSIRKVGVTTGCRWCAQDGDCELQKVVNYLKISEIIFPVYYQGLEVERYDPFFDRDYNLCIYCGRCFRICDEHRKSYVLSLHHRGKDSTIGPAFKMTHVEADCEFCGACVSVCPTGTMSEKNRKWSGVPDSFEPSTCPFCSLHCKVQVLTKKDKVIGTLPPGDPHLSGGDLCVKGRFVMNELINHPERLLEPEYRFPEAMGIVSWPEAESHFAESVRNLGTDQSAMFLSPDLTLEELAAAKQFADQVLKTTHITSSALTNNMLQFSALAGKSVPLKNIEQSDCLVAVFLNGNYNYGPLTLAVKRAAAEGTPYYQIGWSKDTTSRFATERLIPPAGKELAFLKRILTALQKGSGGPADVKDLIRQISTAPSCTFILGTEMLDLSHGSEMIAVIKQIVEISGADLFLANPHGNLSGILALKGVQPLEEVKTLVEKGKIDLLYLVGDAPFSVRPPVKFLVYQGPFSAPGPLAADLLMPAGMWGEISGTYAGSKGRKNKIRAVIKPPDTVRRSQDIFKRLGRKAGLNLAAISAKTWPRYFDGSFNPLPAGLPRSGPKKVVAPDPTYPFLLIQNKNPHRFHNISLSRMIAGMEAVLPEDHLIINPADAERLDIKATDFILVATEKKTIKRPVTIRSIVPAGFVYLITSNRAFEFSSNPKAVHLRREHV